MSTNLTDSRALNLGCGASFLRSEEWVNVDWQSNSKDVKRHNLLKQLPWAENRFELIYSSHLLEHLTTEDARVLLSECFRLLIPGGTLRLSLPDFEEMTRAYVKLKDEGEYLKSQFVLTEILDQCVRLTPSGSYPKWYKLANKDANLEEFLMIRTGLNMRNRSENRSKNSINEEFSIFEKIVRNVRRARGLMERKYISLVLLLLPNWFRSYHVSRATPGERHMWLYDLESLRFLLSDLGFVEIEKVEERKTRTCLKDVLTLDFNEFGQPIKGVSTMFVEATKPS